MSDEPIKGDPSVFGATVKGEKAGSVEEMFLEPEEGAGEATSPEVPEEVVEVAPEAEDAPEAPSEPAEAVPEDETEGERLVRQATEALTKAAQEQTAATPAAPQTAPEVVSALDAIKNQIVEMGRKSPEIEEPKEGFDTEILDSPEVQAHLRAAQESDDPTALPKALATIANHIYEQRKDEDVGVLRQELEALKQSRQIETQKTQNERMFQAGLQQAKAAGDAEAALVDQFQKAKEWDRWKSHVEAHGSMDGYAPASILGLWLMQKANQHYAATPALMEDGVRRLARQLRQGVGGQVPEVSTTAASAPTTASRAGTELGTPDAMDPEQEILQGILKAAERRTNRKAAAFR